MTALVTVVCPTCGQQAGIPAAAIPLATCNAHDQHKHRRGVHMTTTTDNHEAVNHDKGNDTVTIRVSEMKRISKALDNLLDPHICDMTAPRTRIHTKGWGPPDYIGIAVSACPNCLPMVLEVFGEHGEVMP